MNGTNNRKRLLGIYFRGIAMGAADVVPGVSGGTVAFITGIYEELINSIKSFNPSALKVLINDGPLVFWRYINGNFLVTLLLGIVTSILSLAKLISYLLDNHPLLIWSFFFGLIAASSIHMIKQIKDWHFRIWIMVLLGIAVAYGIAEIKPSELSPTLWMVFGAGAIAICAMILPGISGSFILVLLGMYEYILSAVKELQLIIIMAFAAGCGVGLLSFSHILSWLFSRYHDATLALLTGFLIGSLAMVWPWKHTLSYYQNSRGEQLALEQQNVLPATYETLSGLSSQLELSLLMMVIGLLAVFFLEKLGNKPAQSSKK